MRSSCQPSHAARADGSSNGPIRHSTSVGCASSMSTAVSNAAASSKTVSALWKKGVRDLVMELCCALHNSGCASPRPDDLIGINSIGLCPRGYMMVTCTDLIVADHSRSARAVHFPLTPGVGLAVVMWLPSVVHAIGGPSRWRWSPFVDACQCLTRAWPCRCRRDDP